MSKVVTISTELPLDAKRAYELAQTAELFLYVTRGPMRFTGLPEDVIFGLGAEFSARMWFFSVIPGWMHHGKVVDFDDSGPRYEIYTNEHGGPVTTWNHRLTFEELGEGRCRYTDQVEVDAGPMTLGTVLFVQAFFRYRQWRWRELARVIS